jgi:ankyrin repeat protein
MAYRNDALQYAGRTGNRELALSVLRAEGGADINTKDRIGATPLLLAIRKGDVQTARLLIRYGARQNIPDNDGVYPLLLAAESGHELIVRDLLRAKDGPGLDVKDNDENAALILAAKGGHDKTVKVLLEGGADRDEINKYGETALDVAEEKDLKDVIKVLEDMSIGKS